ncbi:MAG: GNAT family N-acetyltransferase [Thermoplasmatota archaeon]
MVLLDVREAKPSDTAAVVALVNAAYRRGGARAWTTEANLVGGARITDEGLLAMIERAGSVVIVGEREGRVVGCLHLEMIGATTCHLGMLSVDPKEQAGGVGRELLARAEAYARDGLGAREITLRVVTVRHELLAWYERRGYRRTGRVEPFAPTPGVTFLAGALAFETLEKRLDS